MLPLIRPIAFHPASVIFETPDHVALLEKMGVRSLVTDVIDELLRVAEASGCKFSPDFKQKTMDELARPNLPESIMWQDYMARRPMEVETYLGSPIKLAHECKVSVPRIETLYAILHNLNIVNRNRPKPGDMNNALPPNSPSAASSPVPRMPSQGNHRPMMGGMPNGNGMPPRQPRPRNSSNFSQNGMRRPPMNGAPPNGYGRPPSAMNGGGGSRAPSRRGSMDGNDLEEFSHLVLYDDIPEGQEPAAGGDHSDIALRERELQLRQRELALREQEMRMRRGPPPGPHGPPGPPGGPRRGPHPMRSSQQVFDDDDEDDDFFDPNMASGGPTIDPDNFDMMSVTSRKNRKAPGPSASQFRRNPDDGPPPSRGSRFRPSFGRNRSSQVSHAPATADTILDDPLMSLTSNRYGAVDRGAMNAGSRANSLTASRMDELGGPPGMNAFPRRTSHSPGYPPNSGMRSASGRPSPPNGMGPQMNGRPSPPESVRQPVPRYPPGQGNMVAPQQVEQHIGVSALHPPKQRNVSSLTGSASASVGSGELDSERSAHSSQSSFRQPTVGVR